MCKTLILWHILSRYVTQPLVSAVIPSYNRPATLERAVVSVDQQNYENIEIIVVETPPSKDTTLDSLDSRLGTSLSCPLTHICTEPDVNSLAARNIGIERATGDYVAFLDDDDEWLPKKTSIQIEDLLSAPQGVCISVTGNNKIGPEGKQRKTYLPPCPDDILRYQLCWNVGTFSMLMISIDAVESIGMIDETLEGCGDQDLLLRTAKEFDFSIIREPLVLKHADDMPQLSKSYETRKRAHERFRMKHSTLAADLNMLEEMEGALEFSLGRVALGNRSYDKARKHFFNAIKYQPLNKGYYAHLLVALGGRLTHQLGIVASRRGLV